jgi:hypothetical protein
LGSATSVNPASGGPIPWPIVVDDAPQSLSQTTFEDNASNAVVTFRVPWDERESAIEFFCDFATREFGPADPFTAARARLSRKPAAQHPDFEWLYATRINLRGEAPEGKDAQFGGGFIDRYQNVLFTVLFQPLRYTVAPDGVVTREWQRYVERKITSTTEYVQVGPGAFQFTSGPFSGKALKLAKSFRLTSMAAIWTWRRVPEQFLFDQNFIPQQVAFRLGQVNLNPFAGFEAERLYFSHMDIDSELAMVSPLELNLFGIPAYRSPLIYKVMLTFLYKPPPGPSWQQTLDPAGNPADIGWRSAPGVKQFPMGEFESIFGPASG